MRRVSKNVEDQEEKLHYDVETVTEFSYLGNKITSRSECETTVTSRTRIELAKFRECQHLL